MGGEQSHFGAVNVAARQSDGRKNAAAEGGGVYALELEGVKTYASGAVWIRYAVKKQLKS